MKTSQSISVFLTEAETYAALEEYVRRRVMMEGLDLQGYKLDDADSSCKDKEHGAYFFFLKDESNE